MKLVITISILMYLVGYSGHEYYVSNVDIMNASQSEYQIRWAISVFRDIGIFVATASGVIYSFWRYSVEKSRFKAITSISLSILICIGFASYSGFVYFMMLKVPTKGASIVLERPDFLEEYRKTITSTERTLAERVTLSQKVASGIYADVGGIVDVINDDGEIVVFIPSYEDDKALKKTQRQRELLAKTLDSVRRASIIWILWTALSVLIGMIVLKKRRRPTKVSN